MCKGEQIASEVQTPQEGCAGVIQLEPIHQEKTCVVSSQNQKCNECGSLRSQGKMGPAGTEYADTWFCQACWEDWDSTHGLSGCQEGHAEKDAVDGLTCRPRASASRQEQERKESVCSNPQEGLAESQVADQKRQISKPAFDLVGKKYHGSLWNSSLGDEDYSISVEITSTTTGRWTTMDQTVDITVSLEGCQLTLEDEEGTKLVGQLSNYCGNIKGRTYQDGGGEGTFRLAPDYRRKPGESAVQMLCGKVQQNHPSKEEQFTVQPLERSSFVDSSKVLDSGPLEYLADVAKFAYGFNRDSLIVDHKHALTITLGDQIEDSRWHFWEPPDIWQQEESVAKKACGTYFEVRDTNSEDFSITFYQVQCHGSRAHPLFVRPADNDPEVTFITYCTASEDSTLHPYAAWRVLDSKGRWLIETKDLKKGPWIARTDVAEETDFRIAVRRGAVSQPVPPAPLSYTARFAGEAVQCHVLCLEERKAETQRLRRDLELIVKLGGPDIQVHLQEGWDTRDLSEAEVSFLSRHGVFSECMSWGEARRTKLGCALGHSDIWMKRAQSNDEAPWIILEDDAVLNTGRNLPHLIGESLQSLSQAPWDIVLLGAQDNAMQDHDQPPAWINGCNVGPIRNFYGTWAYAITQRGAQRALAAVWGTRGSPPVNGTGLRIPLDDQMTDAAKARQLNILMCMPQAVLHPSCWYGNRWRYEPLEYEFYVNHQRIHYDYQRLCPKDSNAFFRDRLRWQLVNKIAHQVLEYRASGKR